MVAALARNAPHARQPGPQRENAAIAPDAAGAAGEASGARARTLRWGDYGRWGGKNLWGWEGAGERIVGGRYFERNISRSQNEENNLGSWFLVLMEIINVNITFGISDSQLTRYW